MSEARTARDSQRSGALQLLLLALLFAGGLVRTWGRWPDVIIDFGRELYTPWRLSQGDLLFADVAWFNGPLSPYWNTLCFKTFGAGLATLTWVNIVLFAAILLLLHAALRSFSSSWSATGACAVVIACCGFAQLVGIGNYNYVAPYSHEATHGMLLALAALTAARRWSRGRSPLWAGVTGLCIGLAFLTKPEMFLAALAGGGGGLALHAWSARASRREMAAALASLCAGAAAPIGIAFALLALALPAATAWRGVLGAWPSIAAGTIDRMAFYRLGMGIDAPAANAAKMAAWAAGWCALAALAAACSWIAGTTSRQWPPVLAAFGLCGAAAYGALTALPLGEAARGWPLIVIAVAAVAAGRVARRGGDARGANAAAFSLLALALLGKMVLFARLSHYGFVLAMPATALVAVVLLDLLPRRIAAARRPWAPASAGAGAALLVFAALHGATTERIQARKREVVGVGADRFVADFRAGPVNAALDWLERAASSASPPRTMAVFPEGVMLNYLSRLANPAPYVNFMPLEIALFGEERVLAAFRAAPPDLVLVTHRDTAEYGYRWFGSDYAAGLGKWIGRDYELVKVFGDLPLQPESRFGVAVFVRRH